MSSSITPNEPKTLYDKVFDAHIVHKNDDGTYLLYIDRHIVHEVTSPQAFEGLTIAGRKVRRPDCTLATVDHNIPTDPRDHIGSIASFIKQDDSRLQVMTLERNVKQYGIPYFGMKDIRQGIVHTIGPEQGFTLPGCTVVCGDSHTSTHGAFGCLGFGIGTSEVEHVLATQTIIQTRSKNMRIRVDGELSKGVTSKDLILYIIGLIGTAGGTGYVIEYAGDVIEKLSMEARMSMCNMTIEAGARAGMIKPDETTFNYLRGRPLAPKGAEWEKAVKYWKTLFSDPGAKFDKEIVIDGSDIVPTVTWGTSPQDVLPITASVPDPASVEDPIKRAGMERALRYMGLEPNVPLMAIKIDKVFLGSCTNARIEDLRAAAAVVKGHKLAPNIKRAMVVPGSGLVKRQAEMEGLDKIFKDAGFEWREAGCSMCLGMNPDTLEPYERCASTSNRNFEGRQGYLGRTHLMSPVMAAAAAIEGHLTDVRYFNYVDHDSPRVSICAEPENVGPLDLSAKTVEDKQSEADVGDTSSLEEEDQQGDAGNSSETSSPTHSGRSSPYSKSFGMKPFTVVCGVAAPIDKANVDTDMIIPKQFLKTIKKTGLKDALFYELRFQRDENGEMKRTDWTLNQKPWNHAEILVVSGDNFGCGSSREHAPWALKDFGIKVIIAPSFGDIFYNNSFKNGLLPIRLDQTIIKQTLRPIATSGGKLEVDLPNQTIRDENGNVLVDHFEIEGFRKHCLVNGLDDIALTLQMEDIISAYEEMRRDKFSFWEGGSSLLKFPVNYTRKNYSSPVASLNW